MDYTFPKLTWTRQFVICLASVLSFLVCANSAANAAETCRALPTMPTSQDQAQLLIYPETHRFWDRTNILLFSGVAVSRALDYTSTKNMLARGREEILLPDDVVYSAAGFPALEAAGTAASVGVSYLFHRLRHHKLERWISIGHIGVTSFGTVRNYSLKSRDRN